MKKIRINLLVLILLLLVLILSSSALLFCSIAGFNKFNKLTLELSNKNTTRDTDSVFTFDLAQQASTANIIFNSMNNYVKIIAGEAFKFDKNFSDFKQILNIKCNKDNDLFWYFDPDLTEDQNGRKYGYLIEVNDRNLNKEQKIKIANKCPIFNALSVTRQICLGDDLVESATVWDSKNKIGFCYSKNIKEVVEKVSFKKNNPTEKFWDNTNSPNDVIYTKIHKSLSGRKVISVTYSCFDMNNKKIGNCNITIDFKKVLYALYVESLAQSYNKEDIISLFINNSGYLMFCPEKYKNLFSLSGKDKNMFLSEQYFYNANLMTSDDSSVKILVQNILKRNSGKEKIILKGNEYLVSYRKIPSNQWNMALMIKTSNLYSSLNYLKHSYNLIFHEITENYLYIFAIITIISLLISYLIFKKQIVKPIEKLTSKIKLIGRGHFEQKVEENGIKEICDLDKSFNTLGSELKEYTRKLEIEIINRETVEKEIKLARQIQKNIIPVLGNKFDTDKFYIKATLLPARNVSGDFYDAFFISENKAAFIVADVSGKGFPAAFFMAMSRTTIKNICSTDSNLTPGEVLTKANKVLSAENESMMFVTIFLAFYEIETGMLSYANAGHLPPIIFSNKDGSLRKTESDNSTALGVFEDIEYRTISRQLNIGEAVIAFTDGVTEAVNQKGVFYEDEGIENFIRKNSNLSASNFLTELFTELVEFQDNHIADDITVLIAARK